MSDHTSSFRYRLIQFWPLLALAILLAVFIVILVFSRKSPIIQSIAPAMASPGQTIVLTGEYFGRTPRDGTLTLAGGEILPSSIISWSDKKIEFTVTSDAVSGLLTMSNSQGVSKGVLFTNQTLIPTIAEQKGPRAPVLEAVLIHKNTFCTLRVAHLPEYAAGSYVELTPNDGQVLKVSNFLQWGQHQASIELPAGYVAGTTLVMHTPWGSSDPYVLDASSPVVLSNPKTYRLLFQIDASVVSGQGNLLVWVALPEASETGQPLKIIHWSQPPLTGFSGAVLPFLWTNLTSGVRTLDFSVDVTSYVYQLTSPTSSVSTTKPSQNESLGFGPSWDRPWTPAGINVSTSDPFSVAKTVYLALLEHLKLDTSLQQRPRSPAEVWASSKASPLELALTYASILRSQGLSARLVGGFLIKGGQAQPHFWDEFWLSGVGWVPVDPVLGAGESDPLSDFSRMNNDHILWSVTPYTFARLLPYSHEILGTAPVSFQNSLGELTGSLKIDGPNWQKVQLVSQSGHS